MSAQHTAPGLVLAKTERARHQNYIAARVITIYHPDGEVPAGWASDKAPGGRGLTFDETHARAAFMVQAVNSYQPLVDALKEADIELSYAYGSEHPLRIRIAAALAKAAP